MIHAPTRLRPLLGLATLTLIASPLLAQDNSADNASNSANNGAKPAWHTGYALIDDSHLSLHLRNLYKATENLVEHEKGEARKAIVQKRSTIK